VLETWRQVVSQRSGHVVRISAPAAPKVMADHFAVSPRSRHRRRRRQVAAQNRLASARRTAALTADDATHHVLEVRVDGRVEDEVDGKVDRLEQVPHRHRDVEDLRFVGCLDSQVNEEDQQFGGDKKGDEEDDNDDEGEGDTMSCLFTAYASGPPRHGLPERKGRLVAREHRRAQRADEVSVAEDEHAQRHDDAENEVRPRVGEVGRRVAL